MYSDNDDKKPSRINFSIFRYLGFKVLALILLALLLFISAGCGGGDEKKAVVKEEAAGNIYTVSDDSGAKLQLKEAPVRIVSLSISTDEILLSLVDKKRIVAVSYLADDPGISNISDMVKDIPYRSRGLGAESIMSMRPDLVIVPNFVKPELITTLRDLGLNVYMYKTPSSIDDVKKAISNIAYLVHEEEKGKMLISEMDEKIGYVRERTADIPSDKRKRAMSITADGAYYAPRSSFGNVCREAALVDATRDLDYKGTQQLSQEEIVRLNPDICFVPDWLGTGKASNGKDVRAIMQNPAYKNMIAIRKHQVYEVPAAEMMSVSQYMADAVVTLAKMAYPDRFKEEAPLQKSEEKTA